MLLDPRSDQVVRDAVRAHLTGARRMHLTGLGRVESRRGHYELLDGVVIDSGDKAMRGAEFVGWLVHPSGEPQVVRLWSPRARAIFVQPAGNHRVTLTSATLRTEGAWSPVPQPSANRGSSTAHRGSFVPHIPPDHPVTQSSPPPPVEAALEPLAADGPTEPGVPLLLRKSTPANQVGPARPAQVAPPRPALAPPPLPSLGAPRAEQPRDLDASPSPPSARPDLPRKRPPPLPVDTKRPPPSARPAPHAHTKIAPSLPPVPLAPKPGLSPRPPVHRVAPVPPPPPPPPSVDELAITQRRAPPAPPSVPIPLRRANG